MVVEPPPPSLRPDRRFDARFDASDARWQAFEEQVERRFDALERRMSRQFLWLAGMQFTALLAIMTALFAR